MPKLVITIQILHDICMVRVVTLNFLFKDWLYPQMIQAIKKVKDSIILVFSLTKLSNLVNYS